MLEGHPCALGVVKGINGEASVESPVGGLCFRRQGQTGQAKGAAQFGEARVPSGEAAAIGGQEKAARHVQVLMKEPADQIPMVAETGRMAAGGREQEAGIFDGAAGEHEDLRPHLEGPTIERADHDALDGTPGCAGQELSGVGVQEDVNVGSAAQLFAKALAEPEAGTAPAVVVPDKPLEAIRRKFPEGDAHPFPGAGIIEIRSDAAEVMGTAQVRLQLGAGNGPSAPRHPRPFLVIDGVEGCANTAPAIGASPETPAAAFMELLKVFFADAIGRAEALDAVFPPIAATFEQNHLEWRGEKISSEGNAGRAAADDTHVGFDGGIVREGSYVRDHRVTIRGPGAQ